MNKIDLKLIIWGIISALAVFTALVSESPVMLAVFIAVSLFAMFIVSLAGHPVVRVFTVLLVFIGANFASGIPGIACSALLVIIPALVMSYTIRLSKDFSTTLCVGSAVSCLGIMVYDRFFIPSGIRVIFSSAVDGVKESWTAVFTQVSEQSGVDFSLPIGLLDNYFYAMKLMLPAIIIIVVLFVVFMVLLASRRFILGIPVPPFFMMRVPKVIAYAYCLGYIFSTFFSGDTGIVLNNAVVVLTAVMMVSGLSLLRFATRLIHSGVLSVIVFVVALPIAFNIPYLLVTAATIDAIIDFRRRRR